MDNSALISMQTLVFGAGTVTNIILTIIFLVFAIVVVKGRRPEAGTWIVVAAIVMLISALMLPTLSAVTTMVIGAQGGVDGVIKATMVVHGVGILAHIISMALLMLGLGALSRPRIQDTHRSERRPG